jgi:hypothetical protein
MVMIERGVFVVLVPFKVNKEHHLGPLEVWKIFPAPSAPYKQNEGM